MNRGCVFCCSILKCLIHIKHEQVWDEGCKYRNLSLYVNHCPQKNKNHIPENCETLLKDYRIPVEGTQCRKSWTRKTLMFLKGGRKACYFIPRYIAR